MAKGPPKARRAAAPRQLQVGQRPREGRLRCRKAIVDLMRRLPYERTQRAPWETGRGGSERHSHRHRAGTLTGTRLASMTAVCVCQDHGERQANRRCEGPRESRNVHQCHVTRRNRKEQQRRRQRRWRLSLKVHNGTRAGPGPAPLSP